jgi:CheY-like chemotaxis protein/anti-sigma regulatory factor (Ser/Thr protein kinase)
LKDEPYELVLAHDGVQALELLRHDRKGFEAMVLDRMMPGMNGLEVMTELKADENFKWIPVVMQTSAASPSEVCEGMEAGVFFYLTKPFDQRVLIRMVSAAVEEGLKWQRLALNLRVQVKTIGCLQEGRFRVQTIEEAYDLALLVAQACPNPEKVAFGLNELIVNGVEHGNLEISYEEKTKLQETDQWEDEIARRQISPEHAHKFVEVIFERHPDWIQLTVTDQGLGFDWSDYQEIKPERLLESHGRGIAMAKALSFDHLEYVGTLPKWRIFKGNSFIDCTDLLVETYTHTCN